MSAIQEEAVHALIIPLRSWSVIVASALVAEVVTVKQLSPVPATEPWVMGVLGWRSRPVPVVSFSQLLGEEEPRLGRRSRVVVFYPLPGRAARDFFAVHAAFEPQSKVFEDSSDFGDSIEVPRGAAGFATAVRFGSAKAVIPDIAGLRRRLYPVA